MASSYPLTWLPLHWIRACIRSMLGFLDFAWLKEQYKVGNERMIFRRFCLLSLIYLGLTFRLWYPPITFLTILQSSLRLCRQQLGFHAPYTSASALASTLISFLGPPRPPSFPPLLPPAVRGSRQLNDTQTGYPPKRKASSPEYSRASHSLPSA